MLYRLLLLFCFITPNFISAGVFSDDWLYAKYGSVEFLFKGRKSEFKDAYESLYYFNEGLKKMFPTLNMDIKKPFRIILMSDKKLFRSICPLDENGKHEDYSSMFRSSLSYDIVCGRLYQFDGDNIDSIYVNQGYRVIYENLNLPTWAMKGLVKCFGTYNVRKKDIYFGQHDSYYVKQLELKQLMDFEDFFAIKTSSALYTDSMYAAQAWGLCHYFMFNEDSELKSKFLKFVSASKNGVDEDVFIEIFGYDFKELKHKLKAYGDGLYLDTRDHRFKLGDRESYYRMVCFNKDAFADVPDLEIVKAPEPLVNVFLASSFSLGGHEKQAKEKLDNAGLLEERAWLVMSEKAQLAYYNRRADEALELYQKSYELGDRSAGCIYMILENKLKENGAEVLAKKEFSEYVKMFSELFRASMNTEVYFELYSDLICLSKENPDQGSIQGLLMAFKKFPSNESIAYALSYSLYRNGRYADANQVLYLVKKSNGSLNDKSLDLIEKINVEIQKQKSATA